MATSDHSPRQIKLAWTILVGTLLIISGGFVFQEYFAPKKRPVKPLPILGQLAPFQLTDSTGAGFGSQQLQGKIWIADFIFTRCGGPCPMMSQGLSKLQPFLHSGGDIELVSISVDPDHDSPEIMKTYAKGFSANENLWHFLCAPKDQIRYLINEQFKLPLGKAEATLAPNDPTYILHSTTYVLVDGKGRIRGYYDSSDPFALDDILADAQKLLKVQRALPTLNAFLNSTCVILLLSGYRAVKKKRYALHRSLMIAALFTSATFLASYLTYHFAIHLTKPYVGPYRNLYLILLASHTLLAIGVLPLVLLTVTSAMKAQKLAPSFSESPDFHLHFARHRKMARWTFPIWLYVSFTGVIVYLVLYQLPPYLTP